MSEVSKNQKFVYKVIPRHTIDYSDCSILGQLKNVVKHLIASTSKGKNEVCITRIDTDDFILTKEQQQLYKNCISRICLEMCKINQVISEFNIKYRDIITLRYLDPSSLSIFTIKRFNLKEIVRYAKRPVYTHFCFDSKFSQTHIDLLTKEGFIIEERKEDSYYVYPSKHLISPIDEILDEIKGIFDQCEKSEEEYIHVETSVDVGKILDDFSTVSDNIRVTQIS